MIALIVCEYFTISRELVKSLNLLCIVGKHLYIIIHCFSPNQNVLGSWQEFFTKYTKQIAAYVMEAHILSKKRGTYVAIASGSMY